MAIDTIKIKSPGLTPEIVRKVESLYRSKRKLSMSLDSGEIEHEVTAASLKGSYDAHISMKVEYVGLNSDGRGPSKVQFEPFLLVECSVHKVMAGHNVRGGSEDLLASVRWLVDFMSEAIGAKLPSADDWTVRQLDVAEVFSLPSYEAVTEWFGGLCLGDHYRKRQILRYGRNGVQIGGHTTCLKFYHKGPEFLKHDAKRLNKIIGSEQVAELQALADTILRVEVSVKGQKLDYDFGHPPKVSEISPGYMRSVYVKEIGSFLRYGVIGVNTVRKPESVKRRLLEQYGQRLGSNLYSTWLELAVCGETTVKGDMKPTSFYKHIRHLQEAGCSWHGTGIFNECNLVPEGFTPTLQDSRRLIGELPSIEDKLEPFRI